MKGDMPKMLIEEEIEMYKDQLAYAKNIIERAGELLDYSTETDDVSFACHQISAGNALQAAAHMRIKQLEKISSDTELKRVYLTPATRKALDDLTT
jgi:hypothetical protein